jgi:HEPN domain-containing protein
LPGPEHVEVARLLLEKATGDLAALRVLAADPNQADHVVGLHAQQAVEKSIKAVLASREVEIPRTHDLGYLATLVERPPVEVADSRWLTPWAGGWRYDTEGSPVDRGEALRVAEVAVSWAGEVIAEAAPSRAESGGSACQ